ncbi:uncharacterized protein EDB91DRAFT_1051487, partial [Suillus paluster]|uniref:uncharacterized protein n=1 Tax=Suillus paluster TaxID=48578 RepID=UPI001B86CC00
YVGILGFTILVWDHVVTIVDEIELIWQGPKGILVYLFLLNRYLTPLGFIVNLVAYNLPTWGYTVSFDVCQHFVRYEGAMTAIGIEIVGLMMLLRVFAMYRHQQVAIALAVFLLLAWIVVTAWLLSHGQGMVPPSPHNIQVYDVPSCLSLRQSSLGSSASASAWLPLLYDTYVFGLTLYRTLPSIRNKEAGHVVRALFADGLLYYSVICTINLILTVMIIRAPEGLRNIAAQYVTMMSRITLNLKKQAFHGPSPHHSEVDSIIMSTRNAISTPSGGVVVLGRLRSGSASSVPPVRTITFAENPSLSTTRPRLSTICSATNTPTILSPIDGSPVSDHADWPPASKSDQRNTAGIV